MSSRKRRGITARSPLVILVVGLVLGGAGSAFAASGLGSLVTTDDSPNAKASQEVIGSQTGGRRLSPDSTSGPNVLPGAQGSEPSGTSPATGTGQGAGPGAGASGGGSKSLPFTGVLALSVLLAGSVLLVGGAALRRRSTRRALPTGALPG
jgi:hypothetical protein